MTANRKDDGVVIRPLLIEDNEAVASVIRSVLRDEFEETDEEIDAMLPELSDLFAYYAPDSRAYFVAALDSELVGGAGIAPLTDSIEATCELQKMYLSATARGRGIGSMLLAKCLEFARGAGYEACYLRQR